MTNTQILYSDGDIFIPIEFSVKFKGIKVEKNCPRSVNEKNLDDGRKDLDGTD